MKRTKEDVRPIFWYMFCPSELTFLCIEATFSISRSRFFPIKISFEIWAFVCSILPWVRKLTMILE